MSNNVGFAFEEKRPDKAVEGCSVTADRNGTVYVEGKQNYCNRSSGDANGGGYGGSCSDGSSLVCEKDTRVINNSRSTNGCSIKGKICANNEQLKNRNGVVQERIHQKHENTVCEKDANESPQNDSNIDASVVGSGHIVTTGLRLCASEYVGMNTVGNKYSSFENEQSFEKSSLDMQQVGEQNGDFTKQAISSGDNRHYFDKVGSKMVNVKGDKNIPDNDIKDNSKLSSDIIGILREENTKNSVANYNNVYNRTDINDVKGTIADATSSDINTVGKVNNKMADVFEAAYEKMDVLLSYGAGETSTFRWSGCSATTVLIESTTAKDRAIETRVENVSNWNSMNSVAHSTPLLNERYTPISQLPPPAAVAGVTDPDEIFGKIYIANVGNVGAVHVKENKAYRLTKCHTAQNKRERQRVLKQGGTFSQSSSERMLNGVMNVTRGLSNHGDGKTKRCMPHKPSTFCGDIERKSQLLIIASAGVWDVLSDQEAASIMVQLLQMNTMQCPGRVNTSLMKLCNNGITRCESEEKRPFYNQWNKSQISNNQQKPNRDSKDFPEKNIEKNRYELDPKSKRHETERCNKNSDIKINVNGSRNSEEHSDLHESWKQTNEENGTVISSKRTLEESSVERTNSLFSSNDRTSSCQSQDTCLHLYRQQFAKVMAEYLVQSALLAGSKQNITAMVVLLPGSGL